MRYLIWFLRIVAVSVAARLYREKCRNGNAALLFWLRMAGASLLIILLFFALGVAIGFVLPWQDIQAEAGNRDIQKKISVAG